MEGSLRSGRERKKKKGLLDLPKVDHEGQDGKGRERKDWWFYLKWIMRVRNQDGKCRE